MIKDGGTIINILSSAALDATRAIGASLYASSKWAVRGYTDALRSELANTKIKVISVYPGGMKTHLHDDAIPDKF
jgi:short-subunit dehydrogenase